MWGTSSFKIPNSDSTLRILCHICNDVDIATSSGCGRGIAAATDVRYNPHSRSGVVPPARIPVLLRLRFAVRVLSYGVRQTAEDSVLQTLSVLLVSDSPSAARSRASAGVAQFAPLRCHPTKRWLYMLVLSC